MITNEWVSGTEDTADALQIRKAVFVDEQGVPEEVELGDPREDESALHLVIYDDGEPVAAGRVWHDGKSFRIGRCGVLKEERGRGIGDLLVKLLVLKAFEFAPSEILIHAQVNARPFYERYGFAAEGDEFSEGGIPHIAMRLRKEDFRLPSSCGGLSAAHREQGVVEGK